MLVKTVLSLDSNLLLPDSQFCHWIPISSGYSNGGYQ